MIGLSLCMLCKHHSLGEDGTPVCAAFPGGIPDEILYGSEDHRFPIDGDNDVQFELDPRLGTPEEVDRLVEMKGYDTVD